MLGRPFLSLLFVAVAYGAVNPVLNTNKDLFIVDKDVSPDGFSRKAVLAGSSASDASIVGPLITGLKGGNYNIQVHNQLTDPDLIKGTSIHWHGLLQQGSTWADGAAFVNQCPIAPGETFAYQFSTPKEAGTYWYHSHLSLQYCDGLRGPFIVYDKKDPHKNLYDVDDDTTIITVADWYHMLAKDFAGPSSPDAMLINGKGRYSGGPAVDLSVITVKRNRRYRFRLLSISCDVNFMFQILGHDLNVIEADGSATQPHTVRSIRVLAGQRYSVVVNANQPVGNYWIRAKPAVGNGLDTFEGGLSSAILRYVGAPNEEPPASQDEDPNKNLLKEVDLHAFQNPAAPGNPTPGGADVNLDLRMGFDPNVFPPFSLNGVAWQSPSLPVLNQILSGASRAQDLLPASSIIELPRNKVIEISIPGGLAPSSPHPMHLHGHQFSVVRSEGSTNYNFANPVRRDVVSTGDVGDNVTIRFTTDNSGTWFLHCHIEPHLELGFAIVFAESIPDIQSAAAPPASWQDLCPTWSGVTGDDAKVSLNNNTALVEALAVEAKAKGLLV